MKNLFIGIDVQVKRECAFAMVDEGGALIDSGWFASAEEGYERLEPLSTSHRLHIGIDAPRMPLAAPRAFYWDGGKGRWRERRSGDRGMGRHCEVVVRAHKLANPQWTPPLHDAPDWMLLGFSLFEMLERRGTTYEAFPAAAYTMLENDPSLELKVNFARVRKGPKDMLDAWMAAATVREFVEGRGQEVGGGDGLGSIILPRGLKNPVSGVLHWPQ
jgi:predicted nuclease with RNAse H fold